MNIVGGRGISLDPNGEEVEPGFCRNPIEAVIKVSSAVLSVHNRAMPSEPVTISCILPGGQLP